MQVEALVIESEQSGPFVQAIFEAAGLVDGLSPGRFVMADLGGYLRMPLFPAGLDGDGFEVLISPDHPAADLKRGDEIDLIGPLGRGFEVSPEARRLLLVADVAHLPVLLPLARQNVDLSGHPGLSVALLLSASTATELYPVRLLPPALEVHIVTADGSVGHQGSILDLFPDLVRWADCVCTACAPAMYPALAEVIREVRLGPVRGKAKDCPFAQALVVPPLGCGVGACQGCGVSVADGFKLACTDGPVFDLLELQLLEQP